MTNTSTEEKLVHSLLSLVGNMPMQHGRIRAARIVMGYPVPQVEDDLSRYANTVENWKLTDTVDLVDELVQGNLVAVAGFGSNTRLALTRAGHRALDALDFGHRELE